MNRDELRALTREELADVFDMLGEAGFVVRPGVATGKDARAQPVLGPEQRTPVLLLILPHEPTFQERLAATAGSTLSIPAFDVYAPWDAPLDTPGFTLEDARGLTYTPTSDAIDVGLNGLRGVWLVKVRAPEARRA